MEQIWMLFLEILGLLLGVVKASLVGLEEYLLLPGAIGTIVAIVVFVWAFNRTGSAPAAVLVGLVVFVVVLYGGALANRALFGGPEKAAAECDQLVSSESRQKCREVPQKMAAALSSVDLAGGGSEMPPQANMVNVEQPVTAAQVANLQAEPAPAVTIDETAGIEPTVLTVKADALAKLAQKMNLLAGEASQVGLSPERLPEGVSVLMRRQSQAGVFGLGKDTADVWYILISSTLDGVADVEGQTNGVFAKAWNAKPEGSTYSGGADWVKTCAECVEQVPNPAFLAAQARKNDRLAAEAKAASAAQQQTAPAWPSVDPNIGGGGPGRSCSVYVPPKGKGVVGWGWVNDQVVATAACSWSGGVDQLRAANPQISSTENLAGKTVQVFLP